MFTLEEVGPVTMDMPEFTPLQKAAINPGFTETDW
jgi:hypothetical protein